MSNFLNANGLVDGNIPAGKPCPFLKECKMVFDRCPTEDNPKNIDFSCAGARGFSICREIKKYL